ncbi:MAG: hypothetical protein EXS38_05520 [Opitutus sp.]|nr:hypothetical protein [Opitutus sp.]
MMMAVAALGLAAAAEAQTPPPAQAVRFTVFSAKPVAGAAFVPRANAALQDVVFYPTARSQRYEYRGAMPLRFLDAKTKAVVAEATIPPEIRDALLLFAPVAAGGATGALKFQISVLDDSAVRHGSGGLAIINLSGLALAGTVNGAAVTLKAGLNPTLPVGRSAKIFLRMTLKIRSYQSYANTVALAAKERALLILFPPFYAGSLEVQSRVLVDVPPVAAPALR